jgi:hypothetical protein
MLGLYLMLMLLLLLLLLLLHLLLRADADSPPTSSPSSDLHVMLPPLDTHLEPRRLSFLASRLLNGSLLRLPETSETGKKMSGLR